MKTKGFSVKVLDSTPAARPPINHNEDTAVTAATTRKEPKGAPDASVSQRLEDTTTALHPTKPSNIPIIRSPRPFDDSGEEEKQGEEGFTDSETRQERDERSVALMVPTQAVAEEVHDEERLFRELLTRHNVPQAELMTALEVQTDNIQEVNNSATIKEKDTRRPRFATKRIVAGGVAIAAIIIVAVVLATVLPSRSKLSTQASPTSATFKPTIASNHPTFSFQPTPAPVARFDAFRSILVKHSVSNASVFVEQGNSPQYQALSWLANADQARLDVSNTSIETIIDRYVMAAMYFASNGLHYLHEYPASNDMRWNDRVNFLTSGSICSWHNSTSGKGVFCDPLQVLLEDNYLQGSILTELGQLSKLKKIDLGSNHLTGSLPTELFRLTNLAQLELGNNYNIITGANFGAVRLVLYALIPSEISLMTSLTRLDISYSYNYKGTIPNEIGHLSLLQYLNLTGCGFSGTVPTVLAALSNLTTLALRYNQFTGNLTPYFCNRNTPWKDFQADCKTGNVICSCCTDCF